MMHTKRTSVLVWARGVAKEEIRRFLLLAIVLFIMICKTNTVSVINSRDNFLFEIGLIVNNNETISDNTQYISKLKLYEIIDEKSTNMVGVFSMKRTQTIKEKNGNRYDSVGQ